MRTYRTAGCVVCVLLRTTVCAVACTCTVPPPRWFSPDAVVSHCFLARHSYIIPRL